MFQFFLLLSQLLLSELLEVVSLYCHVISQQLNAIVTLLSLLIFVCFSFVETQRVPLTLLLKSFPQMSFSMFSVDLHHFYSRLQERVLAAVVDFSLDVLSFLLLFDSP
jgi:hypothetical protein